MERNSKNERGITIIALIITIIVMLILVAVSISIALNTGLFESAGKATGDWGTAQEQEQELASGKVNIGGVWYNSIDEYINEGKTEEIDWEAILADANANPDKYLQQAAELGQNIEENTAIGIGTNGKVVNMDLWVYNPMQAVADGDDVYGTGYSLTAGFSSEGMWHVPDKGYIGSDFDNIIIPQYIKASKDTEFKEVNGLCYTFMECTELVEAPVVPETVKSVNSTFSGCTGLINAPVLPNGLIAMCSTFSECTKLENAPELPESIVYMSGSFYGCSMLINAPKLPENVFWGFPNVFEGCTSLKNAPEIHGNIKNLQSTFAGCISLTGTIKIKSPNIESIGTPGNASAKCIFEDITNEITVQVPANSTTYDTFYEAYGESENIKIETY